MITSATMQVWVRVDQKSKRVIGVSDEPLSNIEGKPVFTVAANFSRLDYYAVIDNAAATYGFTVRAKTAEERAAADATVAANVSVTTARNKSAKAEKIREFYMNLFFRRFTKNTFMNKEDIVCASLYTGIDTNMVTNIKPLAVNIVDASNEWRFNYCQPVIDSMYTDSGMGIELNDDYRVATDTALDSFLTDKGFDITTYSK